MARRLAGEITLFLASGSRLEKNCTKSEAVEINPVADASALVGSVPGMMTRRPNGNSALCPLPWVCHDPMDCQALFLLTLKEL